MRFKLARDFYRPRNYQAKLVPKGVQAEIYLVDETHAVGFGGRRSKPDFNFRFGNKARRDEYVKDYVDGLKKALDAKLEREGRKKNFKHSLVVGSILYSSWGYDQTNIDFYQVVEVVGKKSVKIRQIGSSIDHAEQGADYVVAIRNGFLNDSEPKLKRVGQGNVISLNSYSSAYPYDGEPKYETAAGWGH